MQNLVTVSHTVCAQVGWGRSVTLRNTPLPQMLPNMVALGQTVCVSRIQKNEGWDPTPLGWGEPLESRPSTTYITVLKLVTRSNVTSVNTENLQKKNLTLRVPPFKVIEIDKDGSVVSDFLLVIHGNHSTVSYRFRVKRRFLSKVAYFSNPRVFNAPTEGVSLGIL